MRRLLTVCAALNLLLLGAVAYAAARSTPAAAPLQGGCVAPLQPYLRTSVYIDRSNTKDPQRPYSPEEWDRFINEVLIRHVPDGGTVFDNTGWWRRPNGTTFRGIGRTLVMLSSASETAADRAGITAIIDEIKRRYGHQLVIREEAVVCASF